MGSTTLLQNLFGYPDRATAKAVLREGICGGAKAPPYTGPCLPAVGKEQSLLGACDGFKEGYFAVGGFAEGVELLPVDVDVAEDDGAVGDFEVGEAEDL